MLSRRAFIALSAAFAVKPKAEEAKQFVCVEVRHPDGTWHVELRGLRGVCKGQWFRIHESPDADGHDVIDADGHDVIDADGHDVIDADGHDVIDADGRICGGLYYVEETAVTA
jgi:hypothetical protein